MAAKPGPKKKFYQQALSDRQKTNHLLPKRASGFAAPLRNLDRLKTNIKRHPAGSRLQKMRGNIGLKIGPLEIPNRKFGPISPALFYDIDGNIKLLCRDRAVVIGETGYIWTSTSTDGGYTWSELTPTLLPNPDSGIDAADLGDGKIVLVYNHSHTSRFPLNAALSTDGGKTFSPPITLEKHSGEFPAAIMTSDGFVHITYAIAEEPHGQRRIKHVVLDVNNR